MPKLPNHENQLCALMAVQLGLISPHDAIVALAELEDENDTLLAQLLCANGKLSAEQQHMLLAIIDVHLAAHDGKIENCLSSLGVNDAAKSMLTQLTSGGNDATVEFHRNLDPPTENKDSLVRATSTGERYRKLLAHAKGGLGEVSVARDDQLNREVALKELQEKYADDPDKQQRFLLEGEVTGALEHPGIVPVYSLGFDVKARPFYAMRFIRGKTLQESIKDYHDSTDPQRLFERGSVKFRRMLSRLVDVCNAIEYAHSRGVLHRDIKPSNIMLGKYGETYVVDWGMARVLHHEERLPESQSEAPILTQDLSGSSATQMGSAMGTPAFMSPEQASGDLDRVSFQADVYSLGATLYTMLCNHPAFERADIITILRKVQEGEFRAPSLEMPRLPKKLEAICLKAMALVPNDRYASAAELGQDLEAWVADEPILASPDSVSERAFRFVRRHRTWALAGGTAVVLIAVTASVATYLVNRARTRAENLATQNAQLAELESRSRQQAEQRFLEARQTVDTWLTGFSEALQNYPGVAGFRRHMLERAATQYQRFADELGEDRAVQIERGRTLVRLGDLQRALSQPDKAVASYQRALEGLTVLEQALPTREQQKEAALAIAKAHGHLALAANDQMNLSLAQQSFEAALEVLHSPALAKRDEVVITALSSIQINFGQYLLNQNQLEQAEQYFIAAQNALQLAARSRVDSLTSQGNLAAARIGLGQSRLLRGDAAEAKMHFAAASSIYRALSDLKPDEPKYLEQRAMASLYLASAERRLGNLEREAETFESAIEDYSRLRKALPDAIVYQENLALTYTDLGQLQLEMNEPKQALATLLLAKATLVQLVGSYPGVPRYHEEYALALDNLAQTQTAIGEYQQALGESESAVRTFNQLAQAYPEIPNYQQRLAVAQSHEAQIWYHLDKFEASENRFKAALQRLEGLLTTHANNVNDRYYAAVVQSLQGDSYWQRDQQQTAGIAFEKAAMHWKRLKENTSDPKYLNAAAWFFVTCPDVSQQDTATAWIAVELATSVAPSNQRFRDTKALVLYRQHSYAESVQLLEPSADQVASSPGRSKLIAAMALHALGKEQASKKLGQEAEQWIQRNLPGNWELMKLQNAYKKLVSTPDEKIPNAK